MLFTRRGAASPDRTGIAVRVPASPVTRAGARQLPGGRLHGIRVSSRGAPVSSTVVDEAGTATGDFKADG